MKNDAINVVWIWKFFPMDTNYRPRVEDYSIFELCQITFCLLLRAAFQYKYIQFSNIFFTYSKAGSTVFTVKIKIVDSLNMSCCLFHVAFELADWSLFINIIWFFFGCGIYCLRAKANIFIRNVEEEKLFHSRFLYECQNMARW